MGTKTFKKVLKKHGFKRTSPFGDCFRYTRTKSIHNVFEIIYEHGKYDVYLVVNETYPERITGFTNPKKLNKFLKLLIKE